VQAARHLAPRPASSTSKEEYGKVFAAERLDELNLQVRFEHMEKRRQERVRIAIDERFKLLEMEKAGIDPFAAHGSFKGHGQGHHRRPAQQRRPT
jgi:hypothetical protein